MTDSGSPGKTLRELRQYAGLTLDDVARAADTSIAYLSKVETGKFIPTRLYVSQVTAAIAQSIRAAA